MHGGLGSQLELAKIHVQKRRRWRRRKDRPKEEEEEEEEFMFNDTISEGPRAPAVESLGFRVEGVGSKLSWLACPGFLFGCFWYM